MLLAAAAGLDRCQDTWRRVLWLAAVPVWGGRDAGGFLIQRKRLPVDDITLAVYGFLTTFIIYGGIMNVAALVF